MTGALLEIESAYVAYGATTVLYVPKLEVRNGAAAIIHGGNGTGKTSLLRALVGDGPQLRGECLFKGTPLAPQPARNRIQAGIRLVPQGRAVFDRLTADQHRRLSNYYLANRSSATRRRMVSGGFSGATMGIGLSGGESKVMLLHCLLLGDLSLMLLDEPFAGLERSKAEAAVLLVKEHLSSGCACIIADHTGIAQEYIHQANSYAIIPSSSPRALFELLEETR